MSEFQVRTDLALEARESVENAGREMRGVRVEEYDCTQGEIHVTKVYIETMNAAKSLGKPVGSYITIEADTMVEPDEGYHREISECLAGELKGLLMCGGEFSVLVVGLGNREVTADSLGPRVLDNLFITRHMVQVYGRASIGEGRVNQVSCIEPGVMAKTGMETAEIVAGVIKQTHPDQVIVVDALAARSIKRLTRTIQITNTGIQPGSGVGNHRNALTKETLGVPVIAIGVPTVVDAATIVNDALERLRGREAIITHSQYGELSNMYMTGKDVDDLVKRLSYTISEGINLVLKDGLVRYGGE